MIPAAFEYQRATSVDEALAMLAEHGSDAKLLAGGHSLLPLMKLRLARPERLIDIGRLDELRGVTAEEDGGGLRIGALTTYADLLDDARITAYGGLADALPHIGDVQVRNRGTIGGSIAHADPAADLTAVLLSLDAVVLARSAARGARQIAIDEFLEGAFTTALAGDELLTAIRLPAPSRMVGSAYQALEQQASGYPIAGVAAVVGDVTRIAVTGVGERAYRARAVEAALMDAGRSHSEGQEHAIETAVAHVTDGIDVNGDIHADPEYRAAMARVMAKRAIELARARLG
jgi:carbon-monoxide dehydrogenase medium subunit